MNCSGRQGDDLAVGRFGAIQVPVAKVVADCLAGLTRGLAHLSRTDQRPDVFTIRVIAARKSLFAHKVAQGLRQRNMERVDAIWGAYGHVPI